MQAFFLFLPNNFYHHPFNRDKVSVRDKSSYIATTIIDTYKIIISIIYPEISVVGLINLLLVWFFISMFKI